MNDTNAAKALAGLAQSSRLKVFRLLIGACPQGLTPSDLSKTLGIPPSSLSFHLKELTNARLVTQERESRNLIYRPSVTVINDLMEFLTAGCCQGEACGFALHSRATTANEPNH